MNLFGINMKASKLVDIKLIIAILFPDSIIMIAIKNDGNETKNILAVGKIDVAYIEIIEIIVIKDPSVMLLLLFIYRPIF